MDFNCINKEDIFIGQINEIITSDKIDSRMFNCMNGVFSLKEPSVRVYKENACLIRVASGGGYVDLDDLKGFLSILMVKSCLDKNGPGFTLGGIVMPDEWFLLNVGDRYVDSNSLKPYPGLLSENTSIKCLKKELKFNKR